MKINCLTGGLFSEDEEEQELVFRFAVDRINADPSILPKSQLVAQVERIGNEDIFHADKKGLFIALLYNSIINQFFRSCDSFY